MQTHALERAATGFGLRRCNLSIQWGMLEPRSLQHLFVLAYIEIHVFRGNPFQAHSLGQSYHPTQLFNPLNAKLNPICYLLALLRSRHILHVSRIRVKHEKYNKKINLFKFRTLYTLLFSCLS